MAPVNVLDPGTWLGVARRSILSATPGLLHASTHAALMRRELTVTDTQKVTLGIIAAYVVVIALLWNLPYVRWSLWPFKACANGPHLSGIQSACLLTSLP